MYRVCLLISMGLVACKDQPVAGWEEPVPLSGTAPIGEVQGSLAVSSRSGDPVIPFVDGIAFANPVLDGAIHVALFSWGDPGCDLSVWLETLVDIGFVCTDCDNDPSAMLVLASDGLTASDATVPLLTPLSYGYWSTGWQGGNGGSGVSAGPIELSSASTLVLSALHGTEIVEGDTLSERAELPDAGFVDDEVTFAVPYCGEIEWLGGVSLQE